MAKEVKFHKNHDEAERYVLEQGFERTPKERILWLLKHVKTMHKFNSVQKEPKGLLLKKKDDFYLKVIDAFNQEEVEYMVVGGFAVNFHGYNRSTGGLDLWVSKRDDNLQSIQRAIETLGFEFPVEAITELKEERMVSFSDSGFLVELMTRLNISNEVTFQEAYQNSVIRLVDGISIWVISINELKQEKARSKRYKDLDDLSKLEEAEAYYARKGKT